MLGLLPSWVFADGTLQFSASTYTSTGLKYTTAATASASTSGGAITGISVSNQGAGYNVAPAVVISGDTSSNGGAATATLTGDKVTSITVNSGGTGYGTTGGVDANLTYGGTTITVTRTGGSTGTARVKYACWHAYDGIATENTDYYAGASSRNIVTWGELTWADGDSAAKTFVVPLKGNGGSGSKTFRLALAAPQGATLGAIDRATVTRTDAANPAAGVIQFKQSLYNVKENAGTATITVQRVGGSSGAASVSYTTSSTLPAATSPVTNPTAASASTDYTAASGTLNWAAGDTADKTFTIPITNDSTASEGTEAIALSLSSVSGATLGTAASLCMIVDDDSQVFDMPDYVNLVNRRIYIPANTATIRGVLFYFDGTGGDSRPRTQEATWQRYADLLGFAIVGISGNAAIGGQPNGIAALFDLLDQCAFYTAHPELSQAPVLYSGFSAGGGATIEAFQAVPERTIAYAAMNYAADPKGNLTAKSSENLATFAGTPTPEQQRIPGAVIFGSQDGVNKPGVMRKWFDKLRGNSGITGNVAFVPNWNVNHAPEPGQNVPFFFFLFQEAINARYPSSSSPGTSPGQTVALTNLPESGGWIGDAVTTGPADTDSVTGGYTGFQNIADYASYSGDKTKNSWLINEAVARAYRAVTSRTDPLGTPNKNDLPNITTKPLNTPLQFTTLWENQVVGIGQSVDLTVAVRNGYSGVTKVEFFENTTKLGEATSAPWTLTWTPATTGARAITAVSTGTSSEQKVTFQNVLVFPATNAGWFEITAATATAVDEAAGTATVTVSRNGGKTGAVSVAYATASGTATSSTDFASTSGTLSWAADEYGTKSFTIPITNDTTAEGPETFTVTLSSPTGGAALSGHSSVTLTINDDDATPPAPWTSTLVGTTATGGYGQLVGSTFYDMVGGGDIPFNKATDSFRFIYQPLSGDGVITARVSVLPNTSTDGRVGIQMRDSTATGANYAGVLFRPTDGSTSEVFFNRRNNPTNGTNTVQSSATSASKLAPIWLRLTRSGNNFTAEQSADGSAWTTVGTASSACVMGTTVQVGLAYSTYDPNMPATAQFDNVTVTATSTPSAPSGLSATTVSASQINLSWTDNSSNESGFKIERSTTSGSGFSQIAIVAAGTTTYSATGLTSSTPYYFRVSAVNADKASATTSEATATTSADTTAPAWTSGWPKTDTLTSSGFTVRANTDGAGTAYYVVVAGGSTAPTPTQIRAGQNASGTAALKSASFSLTANTETTTLVSGLTDNATYDVYVVAQDAAATPNLQTSATKVSLTLPTDTTAPTWTSGWPKADTASSSGLTVRVQSNETGTAYYVVVADGATAPSAAQVKAGQNASGSAALKSGSFAVIANMEATGLVSGLSTNTAYDVYIVVQDSASTPNLVGPVKVDITTSSLIGYESFKNPTLGATTTTGYADDSPWGTSLNGGSGFSVNRATSPGTGFRNGISYSANASIVAGLTYTGLQTSDNAYRISSNSSWSATSNDLYRSDTSDPNLSYRVGGTNAAAFGINGTGTPYKLWVSFLFRTDDVTKKQRIQLGASSGSGIMIGLNANDSKFTVGANNLGSVTITGSGSTITSNTTYLFVGCYDFTQTSSNFTGWLNPVLGTTPTGGDFTITGTSVASNAAAATAALAFTGIGGRMDDATSGTYGMTIDEFRYGLSYADVTPALTYTVTYNANSSTSGSAPTDSTAYVNNASVTVLGNTGGLARTGYYFAGWNTATDGSGTTYAAGSTLAIATANVTLYAKWTLNTYPVTYDANSADSGTAPANQNKTHGANLTLASNSGTLAKSGFTFSGWNTAADGTGTDYAAGATYSTDAPATLYAKWTALPTYSVSYDPNGATGGTAPGNQSKIQGTNLTLATNSGNLAKTNFAFVGWNTATDGSGTDYATGGTYSTDGALTLYAKWALIAPTGLTATPASATQINLTWTDNSGNEDGFSLERSTTSGSGFVEIATPAANATSYSDTTASAATTYYYRLRAHSATLGYSAYSAEASATTFGTTTRTWTGTTNGQWGTATNWDGSASIPAFADIVSFPDVTNQTITLGADRTITSATFNAADAYTINSGNTLTVLDKLTSTGTSSVTIAAPITAQNLTIQASTGTTSYTLNGANTLTGTLTVDGAKVTFGVGALPANLPIVMARTQGTGAPQIFPNHGDVVGPIKLGTANTTSRWIYATGTNPTVTLAGVISEGHASNGVEFGSYSTNATIQLNAANTFVASLVRFSPNAAGIRVLLGHTSALGASANPVRIGWDTATSLGLALLLNTSGDIPQAITVQHGNFNNGGTGASRPIIGGTGTTTGGRFTGNITLDHAASPTGTPTLVLKHDTAGGVVTFAGAISQSSGDTWAASIEGNGTILLNGNNTYNGTTTVTSNATLGGTGTLAGPLTLAGGAKLAFALSTAPASHDRLDVGAVTFSGASSLTITASGSAPATGNFTLLHSTATLTGTVPTLTLPTGFTGTLAFSGNDLVLTLTQVPLANWAAQADLTGSNATATADPDGDGLPNLLEYALGGNPAVSTTGNLPTVNTTTSGSDSFLTLTFTPQRSDVTYSVEASSDLTSWSPLTMPTLTVGQSATVTDGTALTAGTKRFLRLKITQ